MIGGISARRTTEHSRVATAAAFWLTASAKATARLAEALRAKAEAGSHPQKQENLKGC
jgi:hypothetical protein